MNRKMILVMVLFFGWAALGCQLVTPQAAATPTTAPPTSTPSPPPSETPAPAAPPLPTQTSSPTAAILQSSQAISLTAITMLDAQTGWAIGHTRQSGDLIVETGDGGETWRDRSPAEALLAGAALTSALGHFADTNRAWVIYSSPEEGSPDAHVVWRTQDGGQTWQASQPLDRSGLENVFSPSHLYFTDDTVGWLLVHVGVGMSHDYVALYKSEDGGKTFTRLLDPYNDGGIQACYKNAMLFIDVQHGWLTGTCGGVAAGVLLFRTSDGGLTWQDVKLPAPASSPDLFTRFDVACGSSSPAFLDAQTGYLAVACEHYSQEPRTTDHYLFFTQDGGDTWESTGYPGGELRFFDAQNGLALGKEIHQTGDGGVSWRKISVVSWDGVFDFPDESHAWAIARSQDQTALVVSQDGGLRWSILEAKLIP